MTQPDLARPEGSARTLEEALEQNFHDGTLAGAVEIIASTIADPVERLALEEAATRLGQVPALLARVRELMEALEPFAAISGLGEWTEKIDKHQANVYFLGHYFFGTLKVADFRRAALTLKENDCVRKA